MAQQQETLIEEFRQMRAQRKRFPQVSLEAIEAEIKKLKEIQKAGCLEIPGEAHPVPEMISYRQALHAQIMRMKGG